MVRIGGFAVCTCLIMKKYRRANFDFADARAIHKIFVVGKSVDQFHVSCAGALAPFQLRNLLTCLPYTFGGELMCTKTLSCFEVFDKAVTFGIVEETNDTFRIRSSGFTGACFGTPISISSALIVIFFRGSEVVKKGYHSRRGRRACFQNCYLSYCFLFFPAFFFGFLFPDLLFFFLFLFIPGFCHDFY